MIDRDNEDSNVLMKREIEDAQINTPSPNEESRRSKSSIVKILRPTIFNTQLSTIGALNSLIKSNTHFN